MLCADSKVRREWAVLSRQAVKFASLLSTIAGGNGVPAADMSEGERIRVCIGHPPRRAHWIEGRNRTRAVPPRIRVEQLSRRDQQWAAIFYAQAAKVLRRLMALHGLKMYDSWT